jgi:hypothetical protein
MPVATSTQVATSLGRSLTSAETAQVNMWLADAEMQIRLRLGDVAELDQEALAYVEREAVILKLLNPEGKKSEQIDDYKYDRGSAQSVGQVFITDEWWAILTPAASETAFTIVPFGEPGYRLDSLSDLDGWA